MRIVFMGTRDIAVPVLRALLEEGPRGAKVVGVVTQPDRPAGRSGRPTPPPVKDMAQGAGIPVRQPEGLRDDETVAWLRDLAADVGVVASYAHLVPGRVLRLPPAGWLNVHPSLLPRHRGPSPVAAAILAGDAETGVTLIKLVRAMDAGPIVDQVREAVRPDDTSGTLTERLGVRGAERLVAVLDDWCAGRLAARPQDEGAATYSRLLRREDGRLDWSRPARELERQVRAYDPWPGTFTAWEGRRLVVGAARVIPPGPSAPPPGTVIGIAGPPAVPALVVATGDGALALERLQLEGRRMLGAAELVRGHPAILGSRLGNGAAATG